MTDDTNPGGQFDEDATAAGEQQSATAAPTGASAIFGPFFNAIVAPGEAFASIDANPSLSKWVIVLIAVFSTVMAVYTLPITQDIMADGTIASMRAAGTEMSAEEMRQTAATMRTFGSVAAYASFVFVVIGVALSALLIWVLAAVMGGRRATFGRAFGVASIAAVIHPTLYSLYASVILTMNPPEIRRPEDAATIAPTLGLDLLLAGPDTAVWLEVLYQRIDLFNLWWAMLVVMGCTTVLKLKQSSAIAVAFIIWALFTGIALLGALAQGLAGS